MAEVGRELSGIPQIRVSIPFRRTLLSFPNHLPIPPDTIT
jgi:hypothetical protein